MITNLYYFGCWDRVGHYLHDRTGASIQRIGPFHVNELDDSRTGSSEETKFRRYSQEGWTIIAMMDRSVDSRPGSHAKFLAEGDHSSDDMWAAARVQYPQIAKRLKAAP